MVVGWSMVIVKKRANEAYTISFNYCTFNGRPFIGSLMSQVQQEGL